MRKALSKSMLVMAAASGILTAAGGYAHADASADGAAVGSPGVGSGNAVQVPVHVPVNVCGNTVNVVGLLNPAFGNECRNASDNPTGSAAQGASSSGSTSDSPGVLSGNLVQAPVDVPVNACGNSVDVVGALNPTMGNHCSNVSGPSTVEPPVVEPPVFEPPVVEPPVFEPPVVEPPTTVPPVDSAGDPEPPTTAPDPDPIPAEPDTPLEPEGFVQPAVANDPGSQLAQTGAAGLGLAAGASTALLLGGTVLMRRARASQN